MVKVESSSGKKNINIQIGYWILPFDPQTSKNIRKKKTTPHRKILWCGSAWSQIPKNSWKTTAIKQTTWDARHKRPSYSQHEDSQIHVSTCLDHQCRNQLRPCQSEVHGTWGKVEQTTTSCRKVLGFPGGIFDQTFVWLLVTFKSVSAINL